MILTGHSLCLPSVDTVHELFSVARDANIVPDISLDPVLSTFLSVDSSAALQHQYASIQRSLNGMQQTAFTLNVTDRLGGSRVAYGGVGVVALALSLFFDQVAQQVCTTFMFSVCIVNAVLCWETVVKSHLNLTDFSYCPHEGDAFFPLKTCYVQMVLDIHAFNSSYTSERQHFKKVFYHCSPSRFEPKDQEKGSNLIQDPRLKIFLASALLLGLVGLSTGTSTSSLDLPMTERRWARPQSSLTTG